MTVAPGANPNQPGGSNPSAQTPGAQTPDPQNQQNQSPTTQQQTPTQDFAPNNTTGLQVREVNPPLTPDQVVGVVDTPVPAAALPTLKLEDIKIPKVKNKTIQGHLKAIEGKMIATEKLMKDIVKLQHLQITTEKQLFERKRELYQNTFEEYLLDKTIDFEDRDNKDCICINLPENIPPTPGGASAPPPPANTPAPANTPTPNTTADKPANKPANKPADKPAPAPKPTPVPPVSPGGKPKPNYPWWDPRRYFPQPQPAPKPAPKPTPAPAPSTQPHRPGQKPGQIPRTPSVPRPRPPRVPPIVEPAIPAPEPGVQPIEPYNNIRRGPASARTPVAGATYRAGLPVGTKTGLATILGGFALGAIEQQNAQKTINELNQLKTSNPQEYRRRLNELRLQAKSERLLNPLMEIVGSPSLPKAHILKALGQLKADEIPLSLPGGTQLTPDLNPDGSPINSTSGTHDTRSEFEKQHGVNYASGGIPGGADLELYNSKSQDYFRDLSSQALQVASDIPVGPHTPLPHPGYVRPQGSSIPRPNLRGMPNPMGKPMPWGWQPTLLAKGGVVKPYAGGGWLQQLGKFLPGTGTVMAPKTIKNATVAGYQDKLMGVSLGNTRYAKDSAGYGTGYSQEQMRRYEKQNPKKHFVDQGGPFPALVNRTNVVGEAFANFGSNVNKIENYAKRKEEMMRQMGYEPDGYVNLLGQPIKKKAAGGITNFAGGGLTHTVRATGPVGPYPGLEKYKPTNVGAQLKPSGLKQLAISAAKALMMLRNLTPAGVAAAVMAPKPTADGTLSAALQRGDYKPMQGPPVPERLKRKPYTPRTSTVRKAPVQQKPVKVDPFAADNEKYRQLISQGKIEEAEKLGMDIWNKKYANTNMIKPRNVEQKSQNVDSFNNIQNTIIPTTRTQVPKVGDLEAQQNQIQQSSNAPTIDTMSTPPVVKSLGSNVPPPMVDVEMETPPGASMPQEFIVPSSGSF